MPDKESVSNPLVNVVIRSKEAQIADPNAELARRDKRIEDLLTALAQKDKHIEDLHAALLQKEQQLLVREDAIQQIYNSTSWRLTRPLRHVRDLQYKARDVAAVVRHQFQEVPLLVLLHKGLQILRREGLRGIRARIRQRHSMISQPQAKPIISAQQLGFELEPVAIVQDLQGHYALAATPQKYVYIRPQRPANFEKTLSSLSAAPLFSIVAPVYNTRPDLLDAVLASVQAQWYPHWELILVDDASPDEKTRNALARIEHPQIKLLRLENNVGIAGATNTALQAAVGDFIVFMDHDDEITEDCLYELTLCIEREQSDFIYSDEDKITARGEYCEPHFKPEWSPDTMMSTMFTGHVSCVRHSLLETVGGLRSQYDGCQDWDFVLRMSEQTRRISHVPKVLYHWRIIPGSVAADIAAKPYVLEASRQVRMDAIKRRGLEAKVEPLLQVPGYFRVAYRLRGKPLISIIIPTRDNENVLRRCIDSLLQHTGYRYFEIIILDNGSVAPDTVAYLHMLRQLDGITVIRHDAPFNFSELNNIGVRAAKGELLMFLNDDTEVLQQDWLERMGGFAQLTHIGAVGAKLLYPGSNQVQHAGVLNLKTGPHHAFLLQDADTLGYYVRNLLEYNWLAVTGACLMVSREKFDAIGGFYEGLPIAYNDIDLCMQLHDAGYYNVVCQAVRLVHHESASRGLDHLDPAKMTRLEHAKAHLYERNPGYFQYDPFYSPNLHPNGIHFELAV